MIRALVNRLGTPPEMLLRLGWAQLESEDGIAGGRVLPVTVGSNGNTIDGVCREQAVGVISVVRSETL